MMNRRAAKNEKQNRSRCDRAVAGRFLSILKSGGDARITKVKRVKRSVRARAYENDLKLTIAVERMARDLAG